MARGDKSRNCHGTKSALVSGIKRKVSLIPMLMRASQIRFYRWPPNPASFLRKNDRLTDNINRLTIPPSFYHATIIRAPWRHAKPRRHFRMFRKSTVKTKKKKKKQKINKCWPLPFVRSNLFIVVFHAVLFERANQYIRKCLRFATDFDWINWVSIVWGDLFE